MKRLAVAALLVLLWAGPASAERRYIVRDTLGLTGLTGTCLLLGCTIENALGDPLNQVFVITTPIETNALAFIASLLGHLGIVSVEVDQLALVHDASADSPPAALYDSTPVSYHGSTVRRGYVEQPAVEIVRLADTVDRWNTTGSGTVAVIDTGVDVDHPVLDPVLVPGYDFTRNRAGGSEMGDVDQRTFAALDEAAPAYVNNRTVALVNQRTFAALDDDKLQAFGHGTMVAGVVHLIAPRAKIMPLKAFRADGSGYASDIIRAIYYAASRNVKVINMSFSFASPSNEVRNATEYATSRKIVCVAAAGNDGASVLRYPAAYSNVTGVASTDDFDDRSSFSNYGSNLVWVAAPGEGIVTTYPGGSWAAGWGTSFSAPIVSGAAALMNQVSSSVNQSKADQALASAVYVSSELNKGRLDLYSAIQAWQSSCGGGLLGLW